MIIKPVDGPPDHLSQQAAGTDTMKFVSNAHRLSLLFHGPPPQTPPHPTTRPPVIDNADAVVIIMCFLLTSSTSFEYMLSTTEVYTDTRTGLPCNGSASSSGSGSSFSSSPGSGSSQLATTVPTAMLRDYDEIAFGQEHPLKLGRETRNLSAGRLFDVEDPDAKYCAKVRPFFVMRLSRVFHEPCWVLCE